MTMPPKNDSVPVLHSEVSSPESKGGGGGHVVVEENKGLKKGPWTAAEDQILMEYVRKHGEGNWNSIQRNSSLKRCGKSCRLRWANHLRPNLKKGAFSPEEERLILKLHAKYGNKWARMASQLPGRTDNEIKNYWNTRVKKRKRQDLPYQSHFQSNSYSLSQSTIQNPLQPTTDGTPPTFCFQIQSPTQSHHFPQLSPTPSSLSPLSSPHHSNPTAFSSLPLFDSINTTTNTSSFSSSIPSFTFHRPAPAFEAPLHCKRYWDSAGFSPPISPNPQRNNSMLRASSMPDFASFQLTGTNSVPNIASFQFHRTLSFPPPVSQFNYSDNLVSPTGSVYSVQSELPSNQASQALQPGITFDTEVSSAAAATLAAPEETHSSCALLEHLLQEADQALACGGGHNSTEQSVSFEEKHVLDGYGQWLQSTNSMESSLLGEVSIHAEAKPVQDDHLNSMPEDLPNLLSFVSSTEPVSDASLDFDMQRTDLLFPVAATADHATPWKTSSFLSS